MKHNVLVFPCGTEIGLEIHRSLCFSTHFNVFGASSVDDHGRFVYKNYIGDLPFVESDDFANQINAVVRKHGITFVLPAHDSVVLRLAREEAAGNLACRVLTSPLATCEIARSKRKTYERFLGVLPTPRVYARAEEVPQAALPIFLKPDVGQGSRGTHLAESTDDIVFYLRKDPSLLLLEYLPGREYTVDCFTRRDGELLFSEARQRRRILNGISVSSATVSDARFIQIARKINDQLTLRGAWFFQVKENLHGELVLMEIAARISGTMGLVRCKGVNLVLLSLFDAMGYAVDVCENNCVMSIDRALKNCYAHDIRYEHVYLDLDDVVIRDGKISPLVMAFVFQCINKGIKLHLLTKHRGDLHDLLQKHRLSNTFDEVLWIKEGESKADYIVERNAIFIDDSFAECRRVREERELPVFDSHMLEALIDTL